MPSGERATGRSVSKDKSNDSDRVRSRSAQRIPIIGRGGRSDSPVPDSSVKEVLPPPNAYDFARDVAAGKRKDVSSIKSFDDEDDLTEALKMGIKHVSEVKRKFGDLSDIKELVTKCNNWDRDLKDSDKMTLPVLTARAEDCLKVVVEINLLLKLKAQKPSQQVRKA